MKKLFLVVFALGLLINFNANAQLRVYREAPFTLGGIKSESTVSIMQVLDYPVIKSADKSFEIKSFELTVITPEADPSPTFSIKGNTLNQNVKNYLENMKGKKGKIFIENIVVAKGNEERKASPMIFYFEQ